MIPLRDVIPSGRFPLFTVAFIAVNSVAFLFELSLPRPAREGFLFDYGLVPTAFRWPSVFTSMFLHASWMHFLGNMLFLWIFGDNVEARLGHVRFVVFYLLCGVVATLAQMFMNIDSALPIIGASGAIAGVMGAYFVLYPRSRILALVPLLFFIEIIEVPAILFLGLWFVIQFFSGVGSIAADAGVDKGGVAFWAHIAGFVAGGVMVLLLRKPARKQWA